ncbi:MAG TPA: NAD(P)H-dependent oxidoreductase [Candidatus Paceibacterota bacterium]|jgi:multimeric flavodoxin WrbA|nr:NAD(P)H-dependent oxidoreductase [Candidatus Paceibacterota bacterium]
MPETLNVLVLNTSLKHRGNTSNTEEVAQMVLDEMGKLGKISSEIIRISDKRIPVGLGFKESEDDEWPDIVKKMMAADIVIFATPIWWGNRSSLMQRIIERMDAFDEEAHIEGGRSVLLNKVAGIVITGSEDGAQAVMAGIMEVLSFLNFTLPPQCCTYWVGEVGMDPKTDRERRLKNEAVGRMAQATAESLVQTARILKQNPLS